MFTCEQCRELLWDQLYGLLEPDDSETLRRHLLDCNACQAEMADAESHQRLLAQAARLAVAIPPFEAPAAKALGPARLGSRPGLWTRPLSAWAWPATAAALILSIGLLSLLYSQGLARRELSLRAAEASVVQVANERDQLNQRAGTEEAALGAAARAKLLHLQVTGPAGYQPPTDASFRVSLTHLDGSPADAQISARLRDGSGRVLFETPPATVKGSTQVTLPAGLALPVYGSGRLEVLARNPDDQEQVQGALTVSPPDYVTHLALDRPVYHPGDKVFFRSVTFERSHLLSPQRHFTVQYSIKDSQGKSVPVITGRTHENGLGGGEWALDGACPVGDYTLSVADLENNFPPVSRRFTVRADAPSTHAKAPAAGTEVRAAFRVDFFPEGGRLMAGVPNRIYFRARDRLDRPAEVQGRIVSSLGEQLCSVQTGRLDGQSAAGLGVFTLTPRIGESYRLLPSAPTPVSSAWPLPQALGVGVTLQLPAEIIGAGEPIKAVLQATGRERRMIVGAFCRGRLVAHQALMVGPGANELTLIPEPGAAGVMSLAVLEEEQGALQVIAQRLIYQRPARQILFSVAADKKSYAPGERVTVKLKTINETGQPEPAWLAVSVAGKDRSARAGERAGDVPGYLQLGAELLTAEAQELYDLLVQDGAQARAALQLLLGAQTASRLRTASESLVVLDNAVQADQKCAAAIALATADLHKTLAAEEQKLSAEAHRRVEIARNATQELAAYQAENGWSLRLARIFLLVLIGVVTCAFLSVGLLRTLRGLAVNKKSILGVAGVLLVYLVVFLGSGSWLIGSGDSERSGNLNQLAQRLAAPVPERVVAAPVETDRPQTASSHDGGTNPPVPALPRMAALMAKPAPLLEPRGLAYVREKDKAESEGSSLRTPAHRTIFWQPALLARDGTAQIEFDLPDGTTTLQIQVEAHTPSGRVGVIRKELRVREIEK
jgi:hypothetical protein